MTFRQLAERLAQFVADHPAHPSLDQPVVVRVEVDDGDDLACGSLCNVTVDAGCTDEYQLVLDANQAPPDLSNDPTGSPSAA